MAIGYRFAFPTIHPGGATAWAGDEAPNDAAGDTDCSNRPVAICITVRTDALGDLVRAAEAVIRGVTQGYRNLLNQFLDEQPTASLPARHG